MPNEISTGQTIGADEASTNIHGAIHADGIVRVRPNLLVVGFVSLTAAWTLVMLAFAWWAAHH